MMATTAQEGTAATTITIDTTNMATTDPWMLFLYALKAPATKEKYVQRLIKFLDFLGYQGTKEEKARAFAAQTKAAESATEKVTTAAATTTAAVTKAAGSAAPAASEKEPPKVLNTIPADEATQVPVNSLISATFSEPTSSPTIKENTFIVRRAEDESTLIKGALSLSPDN